MKIKDIFEEELIGDETVMVSLDNTLLCGIIRANESASFIVSCLKEETTANDIIEKMKNRYNISSEVASRAVMKIIDQLSELKVLE